MSRRGVMMENLLGDVLHVDLSGREVRREPYTTDRVRGYLGARGYNARLLWDMVAPGIDALGPENVLIFGVGPLTGTGVPCSGRTTVTCKSPTTGLYLKTNVGGGWGGHLKYAGYSHVVFTGCSEEPVYLWLDDDKVELRDATHLWCKDVVETEALIKEELGDREVRVACIGPGGENLVSFAAIMMSNYNAAGRGGVGAVMGSKRLKAIAVRGTKAIGMADPRAFAGHVGEMWDILMAGRPSGLHLYGTSGGVVAWNELNLFPAYNFQKGYYEEADKISGQRLVEDGYLKRRVACYSCPLGCHRYTEIDEGKYAGTFTGGPEYETLGALGAGCGVSDLKAIIKANALCNRYGLDVISAGSVIQWLLECQQRELDFDREGLDLSWGNGDTVIELVKRIALREGIGDLLAKGVKKASEKMGQESYKWAIQAKGLEQSRVDTRSSYSYALGFAVNPRGPDHLHTMSSAEFGFSAGARALIGRITGSEAYANPRLLDKRAEIVRWFEDVYVVVDSLGICFFSSTKSVDRLADLLSAAIGERYDEEELMRLGRKVVTLEKSFNVREGATRGDDKLPWRLMHEEPPDVPGKDAIDSPEKMDRLLDEYYALHGWDRETSWPTRETLAALDLSDVADQLAKMGKLPEGRAAR
jgi:aldehyde:ferredoxin oxidoreductase